MKRILVALALLSCSLISLSAIGGNYSFLQDSPVRYFSDQDWQLYKAAAEEALDHRSNGTKVTWKNPHSGSWGYFQPISTIMKNGVKCRKLNIFDYANHRRAMSTFEACKYKDGWKVPGDE